MFFAVRPEIRERILSSYESNMARYPKRKGEVDAFLQGREDDFCLCLQYLYGHMSANDVLSFPAQMLAGYVETTLEAFDKLPHLRTIPQELFFPYVLFHRVNSECLDGSRGILFEKLLTYVKGKTMYDAALAVNYWCYAHATYAPADDRTLGPLSVLRGTRGRCGEESVLAVSALRSVGIPARQIYCPRWSHCDDNHAWVEFWADGGWHYLGACEPEPVADRGWFTAAASRTMLLHTHCWADFGHEPALTATPLRQEISRTAHYAKTRTLQVQVLENGKPVSGARVDFQIVNYAELFTLHRCLTDGQGRASFETGLGDLCVSVYHNHKYLVRKAEGNSLTLELSSQLESSTAFDLVPPVGRFDVEPVEADAAHLAKLSQCEAHLDAIRATFSDPNVGGNQAEIRAFLQNPAWPMEEKQALLATLRPKDLVDITAETLADAMTAEQRVNSEIYQAYVLAPRIRNEMLQPQRRAIRALFPEGFHEPRQIIRWMEENLKTVEHFGVDNYDPSPLGCLQNRQVPKGSFGLVFVALCRAFGFPARLEPHTGVGQWLDEAGKWHPITGDFTPVLLTLENTSGKALSYAEHFALARWNGSDYVTLTYPGEILSDRWQLSLEPGQYRLVTVTRQIDGTASVILKTFDLNRDQSIALELPADQTPGKLKRETLDLPAGPLASALEVMREEKGLMILAQPGAEPTEHLLREMLECGEDFRKMACPIHIFVASNRELEDATLRQIIRAIPQTCVTVARDPAGEKKLHCKMQVGDLRLPFVLVADKKGHGTYAAANYNISMAQILLKILHLLD